MLDTRQAPFHPSSKRFMGLKSDDQKVISSEAIPASDGFHSADPRLPVYTVIPGGGKLSTYSSHSQTLFCHSFLHLAGIEHLTCLILNYLSVVVSFLALAYYQIL